jgi:hypothetical protein
VTDAPPPQPVKSVRFETNADGSVIVKLEKAVRFKGEDLTRLTIPRITGRHMRHASWEYGSPLTTGMLIDFAAHVVEPLGVLDELDAIVARDVSVEVFATLGKAQGIGAAP